MTIRPIHPRRLLIVLLAGFMSISSTIASPLADEAKSRVRLSHEALTSARDDFRREDQAGRLGDSEREDYRHYIQDLTRDLRRHCEAFAHAGGDPASLGDACRLHASTEIRPTNINAAPAKTREERISAADEELRASMGRFDEMLLREQERVKSAAPDSRESKDAFAGGGGSDEHWNKNGDRQNQNPEATPESPPSDSAKTDKRDHGGSSGGTQPSRGGGQSGEQDGGPRGNRDHTPDDVGDGSDDDVVARQLREAAEKETDPELRKRLWEEYRHYKQGL